MEAQKAELADFDSNVNRYSVYIKVLLVVFLFVLVYFFYLALMMLDYALNVPLTCILEDGFYICQPIIDACEYYK